MRNARFELRQISAFRISHFAFLFYDGGMRDNGGFDDDVIDIKQPRRRRWLPYMLGGVLVGLLLFGRGLLEFYVDALWFSSLGYADVYWYKFRLGALVFIVFLVVI